MRKQGMTRWILFGLLLFLLQSSLVVSAAENDAALGKIIHVVYDDSRSMYLNNETRWCQAKYAMEVFCAMMGEEDTMNIYSMNRSDILTIQGADPDRVEKVHGMTSLYAGTPFSTVQKAGNALEQERADYERWLVVLTDGSFDNTTQATVQSTLDRYNAAGIKTVYLAIGDNAVELQGDPANGAYAEKAATTEDILTKVTNIANQIFEHQVLNDRFVSDSGSTTCLNIDIPTEQIVVFAQGEGATVGDLSLNGTVLQPASVQNVRHSGDIMPLNQEEIYVDTTLYGVVVTFEAGETPFQSGEFLLSVSNATTVEYYYRPGVTVNCELLYRDQPVQSDDTLYAGEYEVALSFIDPFTGKTIESDLLSTAQFTLSVTNDGEDQTVAKKTGKVSLAEGEVAIRATAELPGNVYLSSSKTYTVVPKPIDLVLGFSPGSGAYTPDQLTGKGTPVLLSAVNSDTGEPLTEEEWNIAEVAVSEEGGTFWEISKGETVGTWQMYPLSRDGTISGVVPGEYDFAVSVSYQNGDQYAYGTGNFPATVLAYGGNALRIDISSPESVYDLNDFDTPEKLQIQVAYEDPLTGDFLPLTEDMWNTLQLFASSEQRMAWTIEKGDAVGTWLLQPGYYAGDPLLTESGSVVVEITAEGTSGEYTYSGEGRQELEFEKLSLENFLWMFLPRFFVLLFLLWLVVGYIKKKRLRTRGLNPRCRFKNTTSPKQKISKDFFSVVLPYVPEKATVRCHKAAFQCNFPDLRIQATGRRSFKIINKTFPLKTTKICGELYKDMETLRSRSFSFGSFDIVSVDPRANSRKLGSFTFN